MHKRSNTAMSEIYVDLLVAEYISRKAVNSRYSERAFASAVGLSPGFLKLLFQGKKKLSVARAQEVASRLNFREPKRSKFLKSVRGAADKASSHLSGKNLLQENEFTEISDWFCFAIVELVKVKRGNISMEQVVDELGISKTEVVFAFNQLMKIGILKEDSRGHYCVPDSYEMPSISSEGIRRFHRQMLLMAHASVSSQTPEERDLRGLTLAFEKSRLDEARKDIQKFVTAFEKKFGQGEVDSVYQLSLSMFRLDKDLK